MDQILSYCQEAGKTGDNYFGCPFETQAWGEQVGRETPSNWEAISPGLIAVREESPRLLLTPWHRANEQRMVSAMEKEGERSYFWRSYYILQEGSGQFNI